MTGLDRELARVQSDARQVRRLGDAHALVDEDADLVLVDGGSSRAAVALVALLLDLEPVAALGTEPGPDWAADVTEVRRLVLSCRRHLGDSGDLLAALGDDALTRLVTQLDVLAERETAVLLGDGLLPVAAALLSSRSQFGRYLSAGTPVGPAGRAALASLRLTPLLDLDLGGRAGDYVLALLAERARG